MTWALLDRNLDYLIQAILDCSYDDAHSVGTALDSVAGRCNLLKHLASTHAPTKEWRAVFRHMMNHIQNELSGRRNRIVHDHWMESAKPQVAFKIDRRIKGKIQSDGLVLEHQYDTMEAIAVDDIYAFNERVVNAVIATTYAARDLRMVTQEGLDEANLQLLSEGQKLLPPMHNQNDNAKPKRQPQP